MIVSELGSKAHMIYDVDDCQQKMEGAVGRQRWDRSMLDNWRSSCVKNLHSHVPCASLIVAEKLMSCLVPLRHRQQYTTAACEAHPVARRVDLGSYIYVPHVIDSLYSCLCLKPTANLVGVRGSVRCILSVRFPYKGIS